MNRYEKYALRQLVLNSLFPPNPENKIFGSRAAFELFNAWAFFNIGGKSTNNKKLEKKKDIKDYKCNLEIELEEESKNDLAKMNKFLTEPTKNPFKMYIQFWGKVIAGTLSLLNHKK